MRVLIYARFSSDAQRATSIDDQFRVARAVCEANGRSVTLAVSDAAISGIVPVDMRPGGKQLVLAALSKSIDIILMEGLDRLSRDSLEQEKVVRMLEYRGLRLIGISDGYDSQSKSRTLVRGVRGLINSIYLQDLAEKTHRGLAGQVARGYHAGSISYGYRSSAGDGGHRLEVDPEAAQWVVWIFERYGLQGWSCQRLAAELNRLQVRSPRGGTWAVSAIYGSPAKGAGVLSNELYVGRYVWNRSQWITDPDTRRRQRLDRPQAEWQVDHRPELCIVNDDLWQAVRSRLQAPRRLGGSKGAGPPSRTLFGGLLRCGSCGGAMIAVSATRYGCAARKDRGPSVCPGILVPRALVDRRLGTELREQLLAPEAVAAARELARQLTQPATAAKTESARLSQIEAEIGRLVDAIAQIGTSPALQTRLRTAEQEQAALQSKAAQPAARMPSAEDLVRGYREAVLELHAVLGADVPRARVLLQELLGEVRIEADGDALYAVREAEAQPAALMAAGDASLNWVAGARFVPWRRLRLR